VDRQAFDAWKDEAFELWRQWSELYPSDSNTCGILQKMHQNWYLVNIVDNNFKSRFAIFDMIEHVLGI
jgi:methylenetetrahydrofolate reductase (NADPH)